jgi:hypothetical protein
MNEKNYFKMFQLIVEKKYLNIEQFFHLLKIHLN